RSREPLARCSTEFLLRQSVWRWRTTGSWSGATICASATPACRRWWGGALNASERVILNFDEAEDVVATLAADRIPELAARGMATPEHLLRAGRLPIWLDLDAT